MDRRADRRAELQLRQNDRLLIYGIGNVGRQDDGVGPQVVERLEAAGVPAGVTLEADYQLTPEDALALFEHDVVIFIDATVALDAPAPYSLTLVLPASEISFSSHVMSMGSLLALCARMYDTAPAAYALAIPAYEFEVNAELSPRAAENVGAAVTFIHGLRS